MIDLLDKGGSVRLAALCRVDTTLSWGLVAMTTAESFDSRVDDYD